MLVLAITALVLVPPFVSLALHRTRAWWLVGAILVAVGAYLAWPAVAAPADDSWAQAFPDFAGIARDVAAAALALYGAVVVAITYLARSPRGPR